MWFWSSFYIFNASWAVKKLISVSVEIIQIYYITQILTTLLLIFLQGTDYFLPKLAATKVMHGFLLYCIYCYSLRFCHKNVFFPELYFLSFSPYLVFLLTVFCIKHHLKCHWRQFIDVKTTAIRLLPAPLEFDPHALKRNFMFVLKLGRVNVCYMFWILNNPEMPLALWRLEETR